MVKKRLLFAAVLALGLVPASARAACVQADAAGRWSVYAIGSENNVTRCTLAVNAFGNIASTTCAYFGASSGTNVLSGGRITLLDRTRCAFRGSFTYGGTLNTIHELALAPNKATAQGIGTFTGGTFMLNMTRY